jgi:hypothetical protein
MSKALKLSPFLFLLTTVISGCGPLFNAPPEADRTEHFWKYVDGTYFSDTNKYYLQFDRVNRTGKIYQPVKSEDKETGTVTIPCYVTAKANIKKISNGHDKPFIFGGYDSPLLAAEIEEKIEWSLVVTPEYKTDSDSRLCDTELDSFSRSFDRGPFYIPITAYNGQQLIIKEPLYCVWLECKPLKEYDSTSFANDAGGSFHRVGTVDFKLK